MLGHSKEEDNRPCGRGNRVTKVARASTTNRTCVGTSVNGLWFQQSKRFEEMLSTVLHTPAFPAKELTPAPVVVVAERMEDAPAHNNIEIPPDEFNTLLDGCEEQYEIVDESVVLATETNVGRIGSSLYHERLHDPPYEQARQPRPEQVSVVKRAAGPPRPPSQISLAEQLSSVLVMRWLWHLHTRLNSSQLTWCAFGQVLHSYAETLGGDRFPENYHFLFVDSLQDIPKHLQEIMQTRWRIARTCGIDDIHLVSSPYAFKVSGQSGKGHHEPWTKIQCFEYEQHFVRFANLSSPGVWLMCES